jgi:hypothetical protein
MTDIELEQTLAHIQQMRIDSEHKVEDIRRIIAEHDRRRQEIQHAPLTLAIGAFSADVAFLGVAVAILHFFVK